MLASRRHVAADVRAFRGEQTAVRSIGWRCLLVVAGAITLWAAPGTQLTTFGGSFIVDPFARFLSCSR